MSFVQHLRHATAADHRTVDARYGGFRLDDTDDYRCFLMAHGRALPSIEAALAGTSGLPAWRPRSALLAGDLASLGVDLPQPLGVTLDAEAERWGALYVMEGSRLGGQLLARAVPKGLSSSYLSAVHHKGEWRALLTAIDARAIAAGEAWRAAATTGARAAFALYDRAGATS